MDLMELMEKRHSVRQYKERKIEKEKRKILDELISSVNEETGLHVQIFYDEPDCFHSVKAHYGKFSNVNNYIALVGPKGKELLEVCLIAIGYGENQGSMHKMKEFEQVSRISLKEGDFDSQQMDLDQIAPEWFVKGVQAALLAPTAVNQQKFMITYDGQSARFKAGIGFLTKLDLGIVEYHFETIAELYQ